MLLVVINESLREGPFGEDAQLANILAGAIAQYLDDRFSVTNSRMLGLDRGG